jgi:hypothetical protein
MAAPATEIMDISVILVYVERDTDTDVHMMQKDMLHINRHV